MRRIIIKLLLSIAMKIDFATLQVEILNYFEKNNPKRAIHIYKLRACMLEEKEKIKNFKPDKEWV